MTAEMDELWDRVDDAIEGALLAHESLDNDSRCSCGAENNMDGDVLPSHRVGVVSQAVRRAFADQKVVGFIVDDPEQVKPRVYTDDDYEVWSEG